MLVATHATQQAEGRCMLGQYALGWDSVQLQNCQAGACEMVTAWLCQPRPGVREDY